MPNQPSEGKSTFVLFQTGEQTGRVQVLDADYNPEALDIRLKQRLGPDTTIIATASGLETHEFTALDAIFDNVADLKVRTNEELRALLRLRPRFIEILEVRKALRDVLPDFLIHSPEEQACADSSLKLIELYVRLGDNPDAFEQAAEDETAHLPPHLRTNCISFFQTMLLRYLPALQREMAQRN